MPALMRPAGGFTQAGAIVSLKFTNFMQVEYFL